MSLILGIIFGGVVLFIICSWMSVKNPVVTSFWERVEEYWYRPKSGILKISLRPDGTAGFEFKPNVDITSLPDASFEIEVPVKFWRVIPKEGTCNGSSS